uniref:Translation initiation factor IF-2 n=1 Tax=Desulfacinum infernum TaxID=35837 RepID=A0A831ZXV6_9BACT
MAGGKKKGTHTGSPEQRVVHGTRSAQDKARRLDLVVKADTVGTCEAMETALQKLSGPEATVRVLHKGVGSITKTDVLLAATASRLVLGFGVGIAPKVDVAARDMGVELITDERLQRLVDAVSARLRSLVAPHEPKEAEEIVGQGTIIALFKSSRRGIIIGCEITEGVFRVGTPFRVISAMGPVYTGNIESMQIDRKPVQEARKGQQVGIKISDWNQAHIGDLVEAYAKRR